MENKHICGVCKQGFETDEQYIAHECTTGFKPSDVEHQDTLTGGKFSKQAEKALERGEERKAESQ